MNLIINKQWATNQLSSFSRRSAAGEVVIKQKKSIFLLNNHLPLRGLLLEKEES